MNSVEIAVGIVFAIGLVPVGVYFAWRQRIAWNMLQFNIDMPSDHRRYLIKQCQRRMFCSGLLVLLAAMLLGSLFLNYDPWHKSVEGIPQVDEETATQSAHFLAFYFMTMMLVLLVMLVLAVFDFLATARWGIQQQKQLFKEHQEILAAELEEHRHRNGDI